MELTSNYLILMHFFVLVLTGFEVHLLFNYGKFMADLRSCFVAFHCQGFR